MRRVLIVVDMQNDFISGTLGSPQAEAILPAVQAKIAAYKSSGGTVIFTRDTHSENYLATSEGRHLPVEHCILGMPGHDIAVCLESDGCEVFDKPTFGSLELARYIAGMEDVASIELCGLCTDICVVSNAIILKAACPEIPITVDAACCAGVTAESHAAALLTMKMCQVEIK